MTYWVLVIMAYSIGPPVQSDQIFTVSNYNSMEECINAGEYYLWEDKIPKGKHSTKKFKDNGGIADLSFDCIKGNNK